MGDRPEYARARAAPRLIQALSCGPPDLSRRTWHPSISQSPSPSLLGCLLLSSSCVRVRNLLGFLNSSGHWTFNSEQRQRRFPPYDDEGCQYVEE